MYHAADHSSPPSLSAWCLLKIELRPRRGGVEYLAPSSVPPAHVGEVLIMPGPAGLGDTVEKQAGSWEVCPACLLYVCWLRDGRRGQEERRGA